MGVTICNGLRIADHRHGGWLLYTAATARHKFALLAALRGLYIVIIAWLLSICLHFMRFADMHAQLTCPIYEKIAAPMPGNSKCVCLHFFPHEIEEGGSHPTLAGHVPTRFATTTGSQVTNKEKDECPGTKNARVACNGLLCFEQAAK